MSNGVPLSQMGKQVSFVIACKNFFGQRAGTTLKEFNEELKALSNKDRQELAVMLEAAGIKVDPATVPPVQ